MDLFFALINKPSVDRETKNIPTKAEPFLGATHVASTSSFVGTLLLNKIAMFPIKLQKKSRCFKIIII